MTYEEAINKLHNHQLYDNAAISFVNLFGREIDEFDMAIEALEKQMPKKPERSYDGFADGNPVWDYFCPCCHRAFDDCQPDFCEDCGQAIDWGDEK